MTDPDPAPRGVFASIRGVLETGLALLQNRIELLGVEIKEHKARLMRVLLIAGALVVAGNMAAMVLTAAIVVLAGEEVRGPVLIGLGVFYLVSTLWLLLALRKELRAPPPFEATFSELKRDLEWLKRRK